MKYSIANMTNKFINENIINYIKTKYSKGFNSLNIENLRILSDCLYDNYDLGIKSCRFAHNKFKKVPSNILSVTITAIRLVALHFADDFATIAVEETQYGKVKDKIIKNKIAAEKTKGIEDLEVKQTKYDKCTVIENFSPYGIILNLTPATNPTETIICNSITMLSSYNGIVFSVHPNAKYCSYKAICIINDVINYITGISNVIIGLISNDISLFDYTKNNSNIDAILVIGGPSVVQKSIGASKKVFSAGPGNPPIIIDETADISDAAKQVVFGCSFDNNVMCCCEKQIFVVSNIYDKFISSLKQLNVYFADTNITNKITTLLFKNNYVDYENTFVETEFVGKSAKYILNKIGYETNIEYQLIICEIDSAHPLIYSEQLMPILPVQKVNNFEEALELSSRSEHGFKHTATIYSKDEIHINDFAKYMNTAIVNVNKSYIKRLVDNEVQYTSFSILCHSGEGITTPQTFSKKSTLYIS